MTNRNPTVLQTCPALNDGGVERSTVDMAHYTKEQGWTPLVASAGGRLLPELEDMGIVHVKLPLHLRNPLAILWNAVGLVRAIKRYDVDLLHAHSRAPAWSTYLASWWTGVPYITTFHGTHGLKGFGKKFYNSVMVRGVAVIANSKFIQQHIETHYGVPASQIPIALRGADIRIFDNGLISQADLTTLWDSLNIAADTQIIVCVGRLTRWKGQHVLIQALATLKNKNWHCLFVGGADKRGIYAEDLRTLANALHLSPQISFLGSRADIPALNALAAVATSPSINPEAFGRVAIEALAMGTPVVATAHGGSLETIQDGKSGFLVPPSDVSAFAAALETLLSSPKHAQKMGAYGQAWVQKNVTTQQTCQAEFAVYAKTMQNVL